MVSNNCLSCNDIHKFHGKSLQTSIMFVQFSHCHHFQDLWIISTSVKYSWAMVIPHQTVWSAAVHGVIDLRPTSLLKGTPTPSLAAQGRTMSDPSWRFLIGSEPWRWICPYSQFACHSGIIAWLHTIACPLCDWPGGIYRRVLWVSTLTHGYQNLRSGTEALKAGGMYNPFVIFSLNESVETRKLCVQ